MDPNLAKILSDAEIWKKRGNPQRALDYYKNALNIIPAESVFIRDKILKRIRYLEHFFGKCIRCGALCKRFELTDSNGNEILLCKACRDVCFETEDGMYSDMCEWCGKEADRDFDVVEGEDGEWLVLCPSCLDIYEHEKIEGEDSLSYYWEVYNRDGGIADEEGDYWDENERWWGRQKECDE